MKLPTHRVTTFATTTVILFVIPAIASATIAGFGDFSGFTINRADSSSLPSLTPGTIQITTAAFTESRSVFFNTLQDISKFTASYSFRSVEQSHLGPLGATFVLQNSLDGPSEVAPPLVPFVGYGGGSEGPGGGGIRSFFAKSVGVTLENSTVSQDSSSTGLYTNGVIQGGSYDVSPLDMFAGDWINVQLTYNGSVLHQVLTDATTLASHENFFPINIPAVVGGSTAYVGFAAGTGFYPGDQYLSDFHFVSGVPEPSTVVLLVLGGGLVSVWRLTKWRFGLLGIAEQ
jgi:hypothetical protein